jgi:hypothetical protein
MVHVLLAGDYTVRHRVIVNSILEPGILKSYSWASHFTSMSLSTSVKWGL